MKAESTIKSKIRELKKVRQDNMTMLESVKDKGSSKLIKGLHNRIHYYNSHIDALSWVLNM